MFRNIFKSRGECINVRLYIDTLDTKYDKYDDYSMAKTETLDTLKTVAKNLIKLVDSDVFWYINNKFWTGDTTFSTLEKEMRKEDNHYIVVGIIIPDTEKENIDYNLDLYLSDRYSEKSEVNNLSRDEESIKYVELKECLNCSKPKVVDDVVKLTQCEHSICKDCLKKVINMSQLNQIKCSLRYCQKLLIDHDIQMILNDDEYIIFENRIMAGIALEMYENVIRVGWVCSQCTLINKPYVNFCAACNNSKPKYCIPRFWVPSEEDKILMNENEFQSNMTVNLSDSDKKANAERLKKMAMEPVWYTTETSECPVCCMDYPPGQAIILHSCLHTFCLSCIKEHLINAENAKVKCPSEGCICLIEDAEIRKLMSAKQYSRYQELSMRMAEATDQNAYHCRQVNCTGWITRDENVREFTCPRCNTVNCIPCKAIHGGISCEQYRVVRKNTKDSAELNNELFIEMMITSGQAMKCPGCNILIEKTRGCDGVTCKHCGIMMCWATKGPRWGPKGKGDTTGGCGCHYFLGRKCHPNCHYCH